MESSNEVIMEWILIVYLFFGSDRPITQIGPFGSEQLCLIAKEVHEEALFEIKYRNKNKKKKKYSSKCVRTK